MNGRDQVAGQIDVQQAEEILLSSANEDYTGLYEAIWGLNTRFPDASLGAKYCAAERAVRMLHSKGLIEFHRMLFTGDFRDCTYESLDPGALDATLANPVSWYPEYAHVQIVFSATEAGEREHYSRGGHAA